MVSKLKMFSLLKGHWDIAAAVFGFSVALTIKDASAIAELLIALLTLLIIAVRFFVWLLKARMAWKQRNNRRFFEKGFEDE